MAVSDFELLLVTIKNLNQELDTLKGKIATARAELATVKEPARREQLGRTIGGYTTAAGRKQEQLSFSTTAAQTALKNMNDLLETTEKNITQLSSTEIAKGAGVAKQLGLGRNPRGLQKGSRLNSKRNPLRTVIQKNPISEMKPLYTAIAFDKELSEGAHNAISVCLRVKPGEKVTLITDNDSLEIAASLLSEIKKAGARCSFMVLEDHSPRPVRSMPEAILEELRSSDVSIYAAIAREGELSSRIEMTRYINELKIRHAHMVNINKQIMMEGMRAAEKCQIRTRAS